MPLRRSGQVCRGLVSLVGPAMQLVVICLVAAVRAASAQSPGAIDPALPGRYFADVDSANTGIDDIKAPTIPTMSVPEKNRALIKPYLDRMDQWIPLAFFGL